MILSTISSPFIGLFQDIYGQRLTLLILCGIFLNASLWMFYSYMMESLILMGLQLSIFSATVWTTVAFTVSSPQLGWALGVFVGFVNGGSVLAGITSGWLRGQWGQEGIWMGC